jgi:hypothetical protein
VTDFDASFRGPSRAGPFLQGCALLPALAFLGAIPYWLVLLLHIGHGSWIWAPALGAAIFVGGAARLTVLWWRPARWRAYGVLVGLVTPLALALFFFVWLQVASPQLYPR